MNDIIYFSLTKVATLVAENSQEGFPTCAPLLLIVTCCTDSVNVFTFFYITIQLVQEPIQHNENVLESVQICEIGRRLELSILGMFTPFFFYWLD